MIDPKNKRKKLHEADSAWTRSFSVNEIKCLIVCRGPVRKEAMDIFDEIGVREYGILLSEKDSIVYPMALAPELRNFRFADNIHRVPDYMGAGGEERVQRIQEILDIATNNGYTHIFAGYGFMAEDAEFIEEIEKRGITFMGPASYVAHHAGSKDEAKKLARSLNVSVTPGVDNISSLCLLEKHKDEKALKALAEKEKLDFTFDSNLNLEDNAENLMQSSYDAGIELVTIADLQARAEKECEKIWKEHPGFRIRFKHIGGGGGKGQRVISEPKEIKGAVQEVLSESKVIAPGSNRNFLIELNIENTRHNEIQLIGNGEWCVALGGRDCSVQMHEQKLLEISLTQEMLKIEIEKCKKDHPKRAKVLEGDLKALQEMEEESERFGEAVHLDSVSTFESIVSGTNHFFMEMNTRIQVEHRVTEMVYQLKFQNPDDPSDYFIVDSLIEAMAILSLHKKRVPKPERMIRHHSGTEVRINATNRALQPHAGGLILNWSAPVSREIRDDQGIGTRNPDTDLFIHYRLAGAYDSNIALVITDGENRKDNLERLSDIIRRTELRGQDLQTNLWVHYGLLNWILGKDAMFKPSTGFMICYLGAVGAIETILRDTDLEKAWDYLVKKSGPESKSVLKSKKTLVLRPLQDLTSDPHLTAGFIGYHENRSFQVAGGKIEWIENPWKVLESLYHYLNMETDPKRPASEQIWEHDDDILQEGLEFYKELESRIGTSEWSQINKALESNTPPKGLDKEIWEECRMAHKAFQAGLDLLLILPQVGLVSEFLSLQIDEELNAVIPEKFTAKETRDAFIKALAPPPKASGDEIVAPTGGMFYSREAPGLPPMIQEGDHFNVGQPLFIIEVMKMFNKVTAQFSGKVVQNLMKDSDGKIVAKGQTIFKIEPDEKIVEETEEEKEERLRKNTESLVSAFL